MASKYDAINKIKKENPGISWTEAARRAGFEGRWTSYKGKAKPKTGDPRGQARRRAKFDQPSTELAGYEAKKLKQQSTAVSAQAEMFGLEPTQIEHLADQADVQALTAGAGGDPTNLAQVRQSEARFKDKVKLAVGNEYGVTLNPAQESVKVIPKKYFDPIADPNTLPGVDIPIGSDFEIVGGSVKLRAARKAAGLLPFAGAIAGGIVAGGQAIAGETEAAKVTAFETIVGEVPAVGDIFTADPVAVGTGGQERTQMELERARQRAASPTAVDRFFKDPIKSTLQTVGGVVKMIF